MATITSPATVQSKKTKKKKKPWFWCNEKGVVLMSGQVLFLTVEINVSGPTGKGKHVVLSIEWCPAVHSSSTPSLPPSSTGFFIFCSGEYKQLFLLPGDSDRENNVLHADRFPLCHYTVHPEMYLLPVYYYLDSDVCNVSYNVLLSDIHNIFILSLVRFSALWVPRYVVHPWSSVSPLPEHTHQQHRFDQQPTTAHLLHTTI